MIESLRVDPGSPARLADPPFSLGLDKAGAKDLLRELTARLNVLQHRLYAAGARSVLLILQGLDASGKDGVTDDDREGVPQRVEGRAGETAAGADRQPREALEVPARGPRSAPALRRVHRRV